MPALNHIIVPAKDKDASAEFLADILGVNVQPQWGPFRPVQTSNGVTLDFVDSKDVRTQHYAFLVDDKEFDASFARVKDAGLAYFAGPHKEGPGEINSPVSISGIVVNPGDIVVGDDDGVVFIAPVQAREIADASRKKAASEAAVFESIASGKYDDDWVNATLRARNVDVD